MARGFTQTHGVDFGEMFTLATKKNLIHILLSFGVALDLEIHQMDVKSTFLMESYMKKIYDQPKRYKVAGQGNLVRKLNKAIYDLKQVQRVWNASINGFLTKS